MPDPGECDTGWLRRHHIHLDQAMAHIEEDHTFYMFVEVLVSTRF